MKIKVFIERENIKKYIEIKPDARIIDLLKLLKINPVTVIVSKNNKIVVEETPINSTDRIEIYSVVSGG